MLAQGISTCTVENLGKRGTKSVLDRPTRPQISPATPLVAFIGPRPIRILPLTSGARARSDERSRNDTNGIF